LGGAAGTARTIPEDDLGMIALQLQQFRIEALLIVGGFEAFMAVGQLAEHRASYPQFGIPVILLPATISNNVPGTELALGADTSLNIIVQACDEVKQSASSTTRRVFVVEVMGGRCGYLATMAALAGAATRAYIPERGITFSDLAEDITVQETHALGRSQNGTWAVCVCVCASV
jgi:6-phosphofructokinase 1